MNRAEIRQITEPIKRGETGYLEVVSEGNRYVRKFQPKERLIILGGGHVSMPVCHIAAMERGKRAGTENVPAIATMATALKEA